MLLLDLLAEKAIEAARDRGELDGLPGAGQPLALDDMSWVPEEDRAGYRLLKNAGFLPPELEMHREAVALALLLAQSEGVGEPAAAPEQSRAAVLDRLARINLYLTEIGKPQLAVPIEYVDQLADRI